MADHLYEVRIFGGRNHPEWLRFFENVNRLNARAPDYRGIESVCLLKHHQDASTVHLLSTENMKDHADVSVVEVTTKTLKKRHAVYEDLIDRYFLPYGSFPNLK